MAQDNKVEIKIVGDAQSAKKAINEVKTGLQGLEALKAGPMGILSSFNNLLAIGTVGAISGVVYGLGRMIAATLDTADQFNKMSQRVGMSVEFLSSMRLALKLSDVTLEEFEMSLKNFADYLVKTKGNTNNLEQSLLEVADRFAKTKDSAEKTALAVEMFGRNGMKMIPLLNQGKEGLEEYIASARKMGLEISTETAMKAEMFNDTMERLTLTLEAFREKALLPLVDTLNILGYALENPGMLLAYVITQDTEALIRFQAEYNVFAAQQRIELENRRKLEEVIRNTNKERQDELKKIEQINQQYNSLLTRMKEEIESRRIDNRGIAELSKELMKLYVDYEQWVEKFGKARADKLFNEKLTLIFLDKEKVNYESYQYERLQIERRVNEESLFQLQQYVVQRQNMLEGLSNYEIFLAAMTMEEHQEGFRILGDSIDGIMAFVKEQGELGFNIFKAYKIAETIISTYSAAVKAYESLVGIPIIGPALATAAAIAATAFGMTQVAAISSMRPGGGNVGMTRPATPNVEIPRMSAPSGEPKQVVNVHIYGNVVDGDRFAREIIPSIRKAMNDRV